MNVSVGISDWKLGKAPDIIVTYALGSCVGTCIFDKVTGLCGMSHIMLPDSKTAEGSASYNRMKFADTAIPDMVAEMLKKGASKSRLQAKIAGGALMFATKNEQFNIGERNVAAVKKVLKDLNIPIVASDTGLNYGRTVFFHTDEFKVVIKSTVKGINIL